MTTTLLTQLNAIFYKNSLMSKRKIKSHILLLGIIPLILLAPISMTSLDNIDPVLQGSNGYRNFSEKREVEPKYFVVCEDDDEANLALKSSLEAILGSCLYTNTKVINETTYDDFLKSNENELREHKVEGCFVIRKQKALSEGKHSYDIVLRNYAGDMIVHLNKALLKLAVPNFDPNAYSVNRFGKKGRPLISINAAHGVIIGGAFVFGLGVFISLGLEEKEARGFTLMCLNGFSYHGYILSQWLYFFCLQSLALLLGLIAVFRTPSTSISSCILASLMLVIHVASISAFGIITAFFFKNKYIAHMVAYYVIAQAYFGLGFKFLFFPNLVDLLLPVLGSGIAVGNILDLDRLGFFYVITDKRVILSLLASILWNVFFYFLGQHLFIKNFGFVGSAKPWYSFVTDLFTRYRAKASNENSFSNTFDDEDVRKAYELVDTNLQQAVKTHPLVLNHVSKSFEGGLMAVDDVTIAFDNNQIFALLGPNGAGKSTLLQLIAGLYCATSGNVLLEGLDSKKDCRKYNNKIGFCPQEDIFWKLLTIRQHLHFFELLRGTDKSKINPNIDETLHAVQLTQYADKFVTELSGGERRRLTLAMALSGRSRVILLDEPTTGLDPKIRRIVWSIISECCKDRLCILTTHILEEADFLSDRIAIMAHGRLKCIGTSTHLKKKYGGQVFVNFENESGRFQDAVQAVRECCPEGNFVTVVSEGINSMSGKLRFSGDKKQSLVLLRKLLERQAGCGIKNFGIIQSSLEDVFMNIIRDTEADA